MVSSMFDVGILPLLCPELDPLEVLCLEVTLVFTWKLGLWVLAGHLIPCQNSNILYIHSLVRCDNSVFPQTRKFIDTIMRMQDVLGVPLYGHYLPWSSFMIIDIKLHESFNSGIKHKLYYLAYIPFSSIIYLAISTNICRGSINLHIKMQKYNLTIFSKITCAVLQQTMNSLDAPCT